MSLTEFLDAQAKHAESLGQSPHFASLVPLVDRMYRIASEIAASTGPLTAAKLLILCHREFLISATQIQRALPFDSHANTRRAVEIAKIALALKRNLNNVEKWLQEDVRRRRWDARREGRKPERLPPVQLIELDEDPLWVPLREYFGVASDVYVHFTPEFLGQQPFSISASEEGKQILFLGYFAQEQDIFSHAIMLCGLHIRILLVFDAVFEGHITEDAGWRLLQATFDQLRTELLRELPQLPPEPQPAA
jgi:hypothetical protein